MRIPIVILVLLYAAVALGQPRIGAEVASDPLPVGAPSFITVAPTVAMARDNGGSAIA